MILSSVTGLRPCGFLSTSYSGAYIRERARCGFPSTSCSGASIRACGVVEEAMQGDAAPCGSTYRDVAMPRLLTYALRE